LALAVGSTVVTRQQPVANSTCTHLTSLLSRLRRPPIAVESQQTTILCVIGLEAQQQTVNGSRTHYCSTAWRVHTLVGRVIVRTSFCTTINSEAKEQLGLS